MIEKVVVLAVRFAGRTHNIAGLVRATRVALRVMRVFGQNHRYTLAAMGEVIAVSKSFP